MHFSGLFTVSFGGKGRDDCKLQALVYDILPSTTAVFSYPIGPRKLSANEQFFVGAHWNSSKFVTNSSDYIRRLFYNWPCCLRHSLPPPLNSRLSFVVLLLIPSSSSLYELFCFFSFFPSLFPLWTVRNTIDHRAPSPQTTDAGSRVGSPRNIT